MSRLLPFCIVRTVALDYNRINKGLEVRDQLILPIILCNSTCLYISPSYNMLTRHNSFVINFIRVRMYHKTRNFEEFGESGSNSFSPLERI